MIIELTVENIAIIERAQLTLGPGFTVFTGETGAGKSLLVDAIELALGARGDSDLVRTGAAKASVSAVFDLSMRPELLSICAELGLPVEDSLLYVSRELVAEGRSQCRIGGKLTPVSVLRQLGTLLVDLHGQHDHQSLLHEERHVAFLDAWIGLPARTLLSEVHERYREYEAAQAHLSVLRQGLRDREQRIDMLKFQIAEIEEAAPLAGEMEELENRLSRLKHAERLSESAMASLEALSEGQTPAVDLIADAVRRLDEAARLDTSLEDVSEPIRTAFYALQDGVAALRSYADGVEADPQLLEDTAARMDTLKRLRRKYGEDEAAVLAFLEAARTELETLTDAEASEEELARAVDDARQGLTDAAGRLTDLRVEKAAAFSEEVQSQLRDLALEKARFKVEVRPKTIDAQGGDEISFAFSANPGEALRPLAKIASGGEISRVMLAIKTALAGKAGVPTLIFDEVDAGLSGRAAAVVGRKLEELAQHYQVVAISHLPQIASRAASHYRIEKQEIDGRARTGLRLMGEEERVEEVARLLAGETLSDTALANARELLSR
jgi:DNA repair protein RecN (Recombination protein N)